MARSVPIYPRDLTWSPDASSSIRPQSQIYPRIASDNRTSARRRGGRVLIAVASRIEWRVIVHPILGCDLSIGELTGFDLSHEHSPGIYQPLHRDGVFGLGGIQPVESTIAIACPDTSDVINILNGSSYPCQWLFCSLRIVKPRRHGDSRRVNTRNGNRKSNVRLHLHSYSCGS